jgi:hypothetical protein
MIFNRKKKNIERLLKSFGELKEDSFDFDLIEKYFIKKDNSTTFQVLSDKTCNNIDFHDLFMFIDRTNSKIGQQYLYNKLRSIPTKSNIISKNEEIIKRLIHEPDFRISLQRQLKKLNKDEAYYITSLFQDEHLQPPKWFFIIRLLSFTSVLSLILWPFNQQLIFVLLGVFIINMGIHYWNKKNLYQYLESIPQLLRLNNIARELFKNDILKKLNPQLPDSIRIIDKVKNRMSFFKFESKLEGHMEVIFWTILELFKTLFLLEPLLLFGVLKQLDKKRNRRCFFICRTNRLIDFNSIDEKRIRRILHSGNYRKSKWD